MIGRALGEQLLAQADDQPLGIWLAMTAAQLQDNGIGPGRLSGQGRLLNTARLPGGRLSSLRPWWACDPGC
jgi:hypothetical protein